MDRGLTVSKTVQVLGITFPVLSYESALQLFQSWIASGEPHQVCIANVHTTVASLNDGELRRISNAALSTMDGLPLVWYANHVRNAGVSRVCGPDLMLKCLEYGQSLGWRHFFLGGKDEVLADLVKNVRGQFPQANIVGWHSPPFRPLSEEEDKQLVDLINDAKPDFLWVGLGAPKQEKWIASHLDRVHVPVQLGVGAAFDFHSGHIKRAPLWMQKSGLEWVYRMAKDRRLIKRYFSTNPVFLWHFAKDFLLIRILGKTV